MKYSIIFLLVGLCLTIIGVTHLTRTQYIEQSTAVSVSSPEVKKAVKRMGPYKDYRLFPGTRGRLEVRVDRNWLRLQY